MTSFAEQINAVFAPLGLSAQTKPTLYKLMETGLACPEHLKDDVAFREVWNATTGVILENTKFALGTAIKYHDPYFATADLISEVFFCATAMSHLFPLPTPYQPAQALLKDSQHHDTIKAAIALDRETKIIDLIPGPRYPVLTKLSLLGQMSAELRVVTQAHLTLVEAGKSRSPADAALLQMAFKDIQRWRKTLVNRSTGLAKCFCGIAHQLDAYETLINHPANFSGPAEFIIQ